MINLLKTFLKKYWKQDVAECNEGGKEKHKISRGMRREQGVAKTNAGVLKINVLGKWGQTTFFLFPHFSPTKFLFPVEIPQMAYNDANFRFC